MKKASKVHTVHICRRGSENTISGTIKELNEFFRYTLEVGKSYEREEGNNKISLTPNSIGSLIKNLNNAKSNAAANGCPDTYYH
jgi:hypothetical protein